MVARWTQRALLIVFFAANAVAQQGMSPSMGNAQAQLPSFFMDYEYTQAQKRHDQLEQPSEGVSKLDLKAPYKARTEFDRGVQLLLHKDPNGAIGHLAKATAIDPQFVAAHNALGTAYMDLGRNAEAREEFKQATQLDDHLPNGFSNLCHAELALKNYPAAEQAIKKASSLAPLKLSFSTTLIYVEILSHDFEDAIATAHQVHEGKHEGAAGIHFLAASAWQGLNNLPEMEGELRTFLGEDPKNPNAEKARQLIAQIEGIRLHPQVLTISQPPPPPQPSPAMVAAQEKEQKQVAEAERMCGGCSSADTLQAAATANADRTSGSGPDPERVSRGSTGWVLRKSVDEVALFFAATDHGRSVTDLTEPEVGIRDDNEPPAAVLDFRNEAKLPLRLGLVIDTSESIKDRFSFEQSAAADFLRKVLSNPDDSAFVVGFSSSVLMVQDFTSDQTLISHAIGQLAPAGGTALWDAVDYASRKLVSRVETQPVARMLVVVSDGDDNSSKTTLKEAIEAAERGEVVVYTVSTRESTGADLEASVGNKALKVLAEQSGGSAFTPGSVSSLDRSLAELQQVIRSRYLISYKPARFQADGRYRTIDINAQKSGHKLRVYARKGYYSRADGTTSQGNF
jgi:Ca-activated chloride channel family protein